MPIKAVFWFTSDLKILRNPAKLLEPGGVHSGDSDAPMPPECEYATGTGSIDSELPCLQASVEQIDRPRSCGTFQQDTRTRGQLASHPLIAAAGDFRVYRTWRAELSG